MVNPYQSLLPGISLLLAVMVVVVEVAAFQMGGKSVTKSWVLWVFKPGLDPRVAGGLCARLGFPLIIRGSNGIHEFPFIRFNLQSRSMRILAMPAFNVLTYGELFCLSLYVVTNIIIIPFL